MHLNKGIRSIEVSIPSGKIEKRAKYMHIMHMAYLNLVPMILDGALKKDSQKLI